jgi:NAD(P)-dependent dehydrogenase (short-subunit alcohol dehydrogenase family)
MSWSTADIPNQQGRTAVVTGANGGLGLATAQALAAKGAHVVMAARNQSKAAAAREEILAAVPEASLEVVELDLGSLASIRKAADHITANHTTIDLLINNAGVMAMPKSTTEDGFESQLGINHLGHWALTSHLLPTILKTPKARIVTVSSTAQHQGKPLNPEDPHLRKDYDAWRAYGNSKLANRHFTMGLQQRLTAAGVDTLAVTCHPGLTNSDLQATTVDNAGGGWRGPFFHWLTEHVGMSVPRGALSQLRAATDPSVKGGEMYGPLFATNGPPVRRPLVRPGADKAIATLWEISARETGLDINVPTA